MCSVFICICLYAYEYHFIFCIFHGMKIDWSTYYSDPMVREGVSLLGLIRDRGHDAFIVGGSVRDIVMGSNDIHDIDIATNMPIAEIKRTWKTIEYGGGERHGTVIVHFNGFDYELTQFRTEGEYTDGRRPDSVRFVNSFYEDSCRRDFTINAMGIDYDGEIIDHHGGMTDIERRLLRTVGNASDRFNEDALRILRAIRFAARFGFTVSTDIVDAIKPLKHLLRGVSSERIRDELTKTMAYGGDRFAQALRMLIDNKLIDTVLGYSLIQIESRVSYIRRANTTDEIINFALLTPFFDGDVDSLKTSLKLDNRIVDGIRFIMKNLGRYTRLDTIKKDVAFDIVTNRDFDRLRKVFMAMHQADIDGINKNIDDLIKLEPIVKLGSYVSELIAEMGMSPSKRFGVVKRAAMLELYDLYEQTAITPSIGEIRSIVENAIGKE